MRDDATIEIGPWTVGRVGLGGARWSITDPADDLAAESILQRAIEDGVQYIDTARAYTRRGVESHNEALIARVLTRMGDPADVLVATKGGHFRDGDWYPVDASPLSLRADCERSLKALGREAIDLYYLHQPDPDVPLEESVGALAELRTAGKIRTVGLCNVTKEQVTVAEAITHIDAVQNRFSPYAAPDDDLLRLCEQTGAAFFGYSPLGGSRRPRPIDEVSAVASALAAEHADAVETVLLAWLLTTSPRVALITGARRPESLCSSLRATGVDLDATAIAGIGRDLAAGWAA
jgi:aryl-alcohol dehydrogenase-like predicted oxidoreductase